MTSFTPNYHKNAHNATLCTIGSANQRPNTPCIRLWIDVICRGLENSHWCTHARGTMGHIPKLFTVELILSLTTDQSRRSHVTNLIKVILKCHTALLYNNQWSLEMVNNNKLAIVLIQLIFIQGSVGWLLVVLRIYVALAAFQQCRDLEAGDNQSLKFKWRGRESNPGPLAPQAKSLTTRQPPLPHSGFR